MKAKVREFDGVIKTNFLGNDTPKENMHYTCIACITNDSVMRMDQKNQPQVYSEECKYRIKKIQMSRFINTEIKSDSDSESESDSETEAKSNTELMSKLKSDSDSEEAIVLLIIFTHTFLLTLNKSFSTNVNEVIKTI